MAMLREFLDFLLKLVRRDRASLDRGGGSRIDAIGQQKETAVDHRAVTGEHDDRHILARRACRHPALHRIERGKDVFLASPDRSEDIAERSRHKVRRACSIVLPACRAGRWRHPRHPCRQISGAAPPPCSPYSLMPIARTCSRAPGASAAPVTVCTSIRAAATSAIPRARAVSRSCRTSGSASGRFSFGIADTGTVSAALSGPRLTSQRSTP